MHFGCVCAAEAIALEGAAAAAEEIRSAMEAQSLPMALSRSGALNGYIRLSCADADIK